jgi:murein tripeptide amidase MpaA
MNKTLEIDGRKELVVLNIKELETVKKEFRHIGNDYAGNTQELQKQIQDLNTKNEKQELQHKLEIQELQHKITDMKNIHEIEILKKEMRILIFVKKLMN